MRRSGFESWHQTELNINYSSPLRLLRDADRHFKLGRIPFRSSAAIPLGRHKSLAISLPCLDTKLSCHAVANQRTQDEILFEVLQWEAGHARRLWRYVSVAWAFLRAAEFAEFAASPPKSAAGVNLSNVVVLDPLAFDMPSEQLVYTTEITYSSLKWFLRHAVAHMAEGRLFLEAKPALDSSARAHISIRLPVLDTHLRCQAQFDHETPDGFVFAVEEWEVGHLRQFWRYVALVWSLLQTSGSPECEGLPPGAAKVDLNTVILLDPLDESKLDDDTARDADQGLLPVEVRGKPGVDSKTEMMNGHRRPVVIREIVRRPVQEKSTNGVHAADNLPVETPPKEPALDLRPEPKLRDQPKTRPKPLLAEPARVIAPHPVLSPASGAIALGGSIGPLEDSFLPVVVSQKQSEGAGAGIKQGTLAVIPKESRNLPAERKPKSGLRRSSVPADNEPIALGGSSLPEPARAINAADGEVSQGDPALDGFDPRMVPTLRAATTVRPRARAAPPGMRRAGTLAFRVAGQMFERTDPAIKNPGGSFKWSKLPRDPNAYQMPPLVSEADRASSELFRRRIEDALRALSGDPRAIKAPPTVFEPMADLPLVMLATTPLPLVLRDLGKAQQSGWLQVTLAGTVHRIWFARGTVVQIEQRPMVDKRFYAALANSAGINWSDFADIEEDLVRLDAPERALVLLKRLHERPAAELLYKRLSVQLARLVEEGHEGDATWMDDSATEMASFLKPSPEVPLNRLIWDGLRKHGYRATLEQLSKIVEELRAKHLTFTRLENVALQDLTGRLEEVDVIKRCKEDPNKTLRQISELIEESRMALVVIWSLVQFGILEEKLEGLTEDEEAHILDELSSKEVNLESMSHFDVLAIHWSAHPDDIDDAFQTQCARYKRYASSGDMDLVRLANLFLQRVYDAYEVVGHPERRLEYRRRHFGGDLAQAAQQAMDQGGMHDLRNEFELALKCFEQAVDMAPHRTEWRERLTQHLRTMGKA